MSGPRAGAARRAATVPELPIVSAGTAWWPATLRRSLRCALRGHQWTAGPTASGDVVVMCSSCSELVVVAFVDVPDVLGLPAAQGTSSLGVTSSARLAIDLAAAHVVGDAAARRELRRELTARPGDSVDALARLAAVLSAMFEPEEPLRALHQMGLHVEMTSLVEYELPPGAADDRGGS